MKKTALITGASTGIGYELAKLFAKDGHNLVIVARSKDKLEDLASELRVSGVSVHVITKDLSLPNSPQEVFEELQKEKIEIDYLVNNAGYGSYGRFTETNLETELNMIQLNMVALTHLTKLFLPTMVKRGEGRIMNVASIAGFLPGPMMAIYYATKAYVLSFTEAIAAEMRGTGITVTALCPGPTKTNFQKRNAAGEMKYVRSTLIRMTASPVARAGYKGMMKGKTIVIPGMLVKMVPFLLRMTPRNLVARMVRKIQEQRP